MLVDSSLLDGSQQADVRASAVKAKLFEAAEFLTSVSSSTPYPGTADPFAPGAIVYTSGTTGRSKGAILSQAFLLHEADAYLSAVEPIERDVFWTTLPLFHTNALCLSLLGGLLAGRPVVIRNRFSASRFWEQVRGDGGTVVNLLGAMVPILLKTHPDPVTDHPVRLAVGGGVSAPAVEAFEKRFGVRFMEIYGLTETGMNAARSPGSGGVGTVGKALPSWEIRVDAPDGSDGEIQIRARRRGALFDGYWRDEERTAAAFTDDGFFRTGDLGRYDTDGNLSFRGRAKDCIRRRGENISPSEVEYSVAQHPAIAECVAVPVPSELAEDEVKLVYVIHGGAQVTPQELHEFCKERMAPFMVPRYWERRDVLPKTPTQKVERHRLQGLGPNVHDMAGR
ncbi:AMP-binding enzyme C-terminal domain-containing protein [Pseudonocardia thermophila]|uniref:AMP-binding enzyme C-terminal domain-containing protein n=2 Tax=Pseudonocardia thermophila TaxID=1848 RepID=A0A1M6U4Q5_PSETH|nr:AMP-binding enzyme C-terminal domain-containing protein [Pseudonocardia thermophila]